MCLTFWDPIDCSMPSLPVHHQLPKLAPTQYQQTAHTLKSGLPSEHISQQETFALDTVKFKRSVQFSRSVVSDITILQNIKSTSRIFLLFKFYYKSPKHKPQVQSQHAVKPDFM